MQLKCQPDASYVPRCIMIYPPPPMFVDTIFTLYLVRLTVIFIHVFRCCRHCVFLYFRSMLKNARPKSTPVDSPVSAAPTWLAPWFCFLHSSYWLHVDLVDASTRTRTLWLELFLFAFVNLRVYNVHHYFTPTC